MDESVRAKVHGQDEQWRNRMDLAIRHPGETVVDDETLREATARALQDKSGKKLQLLLKLFVLTGG